MKKERTISRDKIIQKEKWEKCQKRKQLDRIMVKDVKIQVQIERILDQIYKERQKGR